MNKIDKLLYQKSVLKELRTIPYVGKRIAFFLWNIGIRSVAELKNNDPEKLYKNINQFLNTTCDRCLLYTLRSSVYYASNKIHNPELLKWWNWKDTVMKDKDSFPNISSSLSSKNMKKKRKEKETLQNNDIKIRKQYG